MVKLEGLGMPAGVRFANYHVYEYSVSCDVSAEDFVEATDGVCLCFLLCFFGYGTVYAHLLPAVPLSST